MGEERVLNGVVKHMSVSVLWRRDISLLARALVLERCYYHHLKSSSLDNDATEATVTNLGLEGGD